jgi:copper chaperone NosL
MRIFLSCVIVLCLLGAAAAEGPINREPGRKERCPVCGMSVEKYADWHGRIGFSDSTTAVFDGPKCTFKYILGMKQSNAPHARADVVSITMKDYYSKAAIDARKAYFVIWGDVYGPMGHEPIPFEKEEDAKRFLKEHKGTDILRFDAINSTLITSLDNPP